MEWADAEATLDALMRAVQPHLRSSTGEATPNDASPIDEGALITLLEELADMVKASRPYLGSMAAKLRPYLCQHEAAPDVVELAKIIRKLLQICDPDALPGGEGVITQAKAALSALLERYELRRKP
jgi:hypothetical protein